MTSKGQALKYFPYEPRENQKEFISFIRQKIKKHNICLNAPTGFGKTPAILAALLPFTVKKNGKIIWAVRTGNETDRPIEELKIINDVCDADLFGFSLRGKKDMCLLAKNVAERFMDYDEVAYLCKTKIKECKYFAKLEGFNIKKLIDGPLLFSEILRRCDECCICPYYAQRKLMSEADVISLNYNYIVDRGMQWAIKHTVPFGQSFLVVDEAHNLQKVVSNLYSKNITLGTIRYSLGEMGRFDTSRSREIVDLIEIVGKEMKKTFNHLKESKAEDMKVDPWKFLQNISKRSKSLEEDFSSITRYGTLIRKEQLKLGKKPRSSLNRLGRFLLTLISTLGERGVVTIATRIKSGDNLKLEVWDMRAAEILKDIWDDFKTCVYCSGTLTPISAFAETIGLKNFRGKDFPHFFDVKRVKTFITTDLSTKGKTLRKEMGEKYLDCLGGFLKMDANLAVFSASYRIQKSLLKSGLKDLIEDNGKNFFFERRGMSGDDARRILDGFKRCSREERKGVLCATMTGRFAEGTDFPGKELEGIFLVGIPFDRMNTRTKLYLDYYRELYGEDKGTFYAYVIPALKRASQSLGRALRSKEDEAVFVLGDNRYANPGFLKVLPDFVRGAEIRESADIGRFF